MPSKSEKEKRRQIMKALSDQQAQAFENSLPLSRPMFQELFDYLDEQLGEEECDDTLRLTETFLREKEASNIPETITWLHEHGGYCDCEVLGNVEEQFEGWNLP